MTALLSPVALSALLCGIVGGGGLALLVVSLYGWPAPPPDRRPKVGEALGSLGRRGLLALGVGLAVLLVSRWPVAGIASAILVLSWNQLFGGAGEERAAMQRVEALAAWTESLRDTIAGAVGLEQAIPASARAAGPMLRPQLNAMIDRFRARMPLPAALQLFAEELDDPSADLVIAALILNSRLRGPGLREVLGALAKSAREEVDMRQRVIAQRASTRRSVQIVVAVSAVFILGLSVLNREFVAPYGTFVGQLVLTGVLALFGAGFWWLRRLSKVKTPERFLAGRMPSEVVR
ncbi:type II secretion system F family protein [Kitasatospora sp. KL5]|uniref:type II secretion system F family protein n=1 Tax=Kitasatospora sp. KL5 TaxID=3425125 RepID=UPI003D6EEEE7